MEKAIKMSEDTWKKLTQYKYQLDAKSLDEVIQALIKISNKVELATQLKKESGK